MSSQNNNNDNYIEEIKEWQEHQYSPGHYLGGNIPPYIKHPRYSLIFGIFYVTGSILTLIFVIYISLSSDINDMPAVIATVAVSILLILFGIRNIREYKRIKSMKLEHKKISGRKKKN